MTKSLSKTPLNSLWKQIESAGFNFYCVGCNRQRRLSAPARIGTLQFYFHILIVTAFLSLLTWKWMEWKGLVAWAIPVAVTFEALYRLRMRAALVCPDCQFDPILYLVDRKKAVHQVEAAWRQRFENKGFTYPERNLGRKPHRDSSSPQSGSKTA